MIKRILFSVFTFLLIACNSQANKESTISVLADSSNVTLTNKKSERFIPETKRIEKFDTLIVDGQIQGARCPRSFRIWSPRFRAQQCGDQFGHGQ